MPIGLGDGERDRQLVQAVHAERRVVGRLAGELEILHTRRQEGECLLQLGARQVRAEAEVRPRPERQRLRSAAVRGDVEGLGAAVGLGVAVRRQRTFSAAAGASSSGFWASSAPLLRDLELAERSSARA